MAGQDGLVAEYISAVLAGEDDCDARVQAAVRTLEEQGNRIVNFGSDDRIDDDRRRITYVDWRTGEVLHTATGTLDEIESGLDAVEAADRPWWLIENVEANVPLPERPSSPTGLLAGLPTGLADAIADAIVEWARINPQQAREFAAAHGEVVNTRCLTG